MYKRQLIYSKIDLSNDSTKFFNENLKEKVFGFLMAMGFSIVSNLFDMKIITHIPQEGETYQAHWENGTSISWETIKLCNFHQGKNV